MIQGGFNQLGLTSVNFNQYKYFVRFRFSHLQYHENRNGTEICTGSVKPGFQLWNLVTRNFGKSKRKNFPSWVLLAHTPSLECSRICNWTSAAFEHSVSRVADAVCECLCVRVPSLDRSPRSMRCVCVYVCVCVCVCMTIYCSAFSLDMLFHTHTHTYTPHTHEHEYIGRSTAPHSLTLPLSVSLSHTCIYRTING